MQSEHLIYFVFVFFIGASLGSFFKLVVDRYKTNESFISKPSYCTNCGKNLLFWHNIPILSYLILGGKCYFCKKNIGVSYFFYELIIALLGLILFYKGLLLNLPVFKMFIFMYFVYVLVLLSLFDIKHRLVPHHITYFSIIIITICLYFINASFYKPLFNLGIAFICMDFLLIFVSVLKKYALDKSFIIVPLLVWSLIFLFSDVFYLIVIPIVVYFLLVFFWKEIPKIGLLWTLEIFLLLGIFYKFIFIYPNINNIFNFFTGIGLIYFICEVVSFYIVNLLNLKIANLDEDTTNAPIALGGGDITVFALIVLFLGFKLGFMSLFLASLIGILSHYLCKTQKSQYLPFVPYLVIACFIIILITDGW